MLQAAQRDRELQCFLVGWKSLETVNQPRGERIACAHPVHDMGDVIVAAESERLAVVKARGPAVVRGAVRFPQRDGNGLEIRILGQDFGCQLFILGAIELS